MDDEKRRKFAIHLSRCITWIKIDKSHMARQFPRFLYSNPRNTKSKGPFIVHTIFPKLICRVVKDVETINGKAVYYVNVSGLTIELLKSFENTESIASEISDAMYDMLSWLRSQINSEQIKLN